MTEEEREEIFALMQDIEGENLIVKEGPSALKFLKEYLKALLFDRPELQQDILTPGCAPEQEQEA